MPLELRVRAHSETGLVRRNNQDSGYASPSMLIVADGMGGAAAGDLASRVAVEEYIRADGHGEGEGMLDILDDATRRANQRLADLIAEDSNLDGMGTTICGGLFDGQDFGIVHLGDSRAYLLRGEVLMRLTHDHSWVQSLIDEGKLDEETAFTHPHRSLLLRVLNGQPHSRPDLLLVRLCDGDRILLCSDGLCGAVDDKVLATGLSIPDPAAALDALIAAAHRAGGSDNITIILADVLDPAADSFGHQVRPDTGLDPPAPASGAIQAALPLRSPASPTELAVGADSTDRQQPLVPGLGRPISTVEDAVASVPTPDRPGTPASRHTPDTPGTPASRHTPNSPGTPTSRHTPNSPGTPTSRHAPNSPGTPSHTPDSPGTPTSRHTPNSPGTPTSRHTPNSPGTPTSRHTPDSPHTPVSGRTPQSPSSPASRSTPTSPGDPDSPATPSSPTTVGSPAEPPLAILAARTGTGPAESPTSPAAGRPADESENTDPMTQVWHGRTPATYLYSADRREQLLAAPALVAEGRPTGLGVLIGAAAQTSPASASRRHHALPRPNASPRPAIRLDEAEASRYTPVVRRGPRWGLIAAISLVCCALLVGLWAAFNYARSQYFVAAANGQVAIYQGFPGDIAGLATNRAVEWTEIAMTDLPLTWRQRVEEGIPAGDGGLYQAHLTVDELAKTSVECLARRAERTGSASAQPTASMNAQPPATTNATPPAPPSAPSSAATATASARPETPGPTTTANAGTGTSPSAPVSPDASSTRAAPADDGC